jgi:hypothetical protein
MGGFNWHRILWVASAFLMPLSIWFGSIIGGNNLANAVAFAFLFAMVVRLIFEAVDA